MLGVMIGLAIWSFDRNYRATEEVFSTKVIILVKYKINSECSFTVKVVLIKKENDRLIGDLIQKVVSPEWTRATVLTVKAVVVQVLQYPYGGSCSSFDFLQK